MKKLLFFLLFPMFLFAQYEDWELQNAPGPDFLKVSGINGEFYTVNGSDFIKTMETSTVISFDTISKILTYVNEDSQLFNVDLSILGGGGGGSSLPVGSNGLFLIHNGTDWVVGNHPIGADNGIVGGGANNDGIFYKGKWGINTNFTGFFQNNLRILEFGIDTTGAEDGDFLQFTSNGFDWDNPSAGGRNFVLSPSAPNDVNDIWLDNSLVNDIKLVFRKEYFDNWKNTQVYNTFNSQWHDFHNWFVFVGSGQSLMEQFLSLLDPDTSDGDEASDDQSINPNVLVYDDTNGTIRIAELGQHPHLNNDGDGVDSQMFHFAKKVQKQTGGLIIYYINALGGAGIDTWIYPGQNYTDLKNQLTNSGLIESGKEVDHWVWQQCEANDPSVSGSGMDSITYANKFNQMESQMFDSLSCFEYGKTTVGLSSPVVGGALSFHLPTLMALAKEKSYRGFTYGYSKDNVDGVDGDALITFDNIHITSKGGQMYGYNNVETFWCLPKSVKYESGANQLTPNGMFSTSNIDNTIPTRFNANLIDRLTFQDTVLSIRGDLERVGIGVLTPLTKLDIDGEITVRDPRFISNQSLLKFNTAGASVPIEISDTWRPDESIADSINTQWDHNFHSGNVSVFYNDPFDRFEIYAPNGMFDFINDMASTPSNFDAVVPNRFSFNASDSTSLLSIRGDTKRIGIGTAGPSVALDVAGDMRVRNLGSNDWLLKTDPQGNLSTIDPSTFSITESDPIYSAWDKSYNDLINTPTIPTNNNQLTNGANYISSYTETDPIYSAWDKSYNDLIDTPTIPTDNNQLTNGANYITSAGLDGNGILSGGSGTTAGSYTLNLNGVLTIADNTVTLSESGRTLSLSTGIGGSSIGSSESLQLFTNSLPRLEIEQGGDIIAKTEFIADKRAIGAMYRSSPTSSTSSAVGTKIDFNLEILDEGEITVDHTTDDRITFLVPGFYTVNVQGYFSSDADNTTSKIQLHQYDDSTGNFTEVAQSKFNELRHIGQDLTLKQSTSRLFFDTNDYIEIYHYRHGGAGTASVDDVRLEVIKEIGY